MYLIDETYFQKDLKIPNLNEMDSDTLESLNVDIDKYVRLFLQNALGYALFTELDGYISNGVLNPSAPQKWLDLVNGKDEWKGLKFEEGSYKGSILAKYVYYHWLKASVSLLTGTGEKAVTATDAVAVNSTQRLTNVWNDFVNDNQGFYNPDKWYFGYDDYYFNCNCSADDNYSLVKFLKDNETEYPETKKTLYPVKNQLGL